MLLRYQAYYNGKAYGRPMLPRERDALNKALTNIDWRMVL